MRKGTVLSTVFTGLLIAALLPGGAAQAATAAAAGTPLKLAHSNKCLNVPNGSTANSAKIIQYTCSTTGTNDRWKLVPKGDFAYWVQNVGSPKCLNVPNGSTANNVAIIQYTCTTSPNTLWWVDEVPDRSTIRLVSTDSGKCLNIGNGSTADKAPLIQYQCSGGSSPNEQFYSPPTASGTAVLRPFNTGKQAVAVLQEQAADRTSTPAVSYSWIDRDNQVEILTDPDPLGTDPDSPDPTLVSSDGFGYVGHPQAISLSDGRTQILVHDAAAGDVQLADEVGTGTGSYTVSDIAGAVAGQPAVGPAAKGQVAAYAIVGGALWYAPQWPADSQPAYGAWRSLGGTGLVGTPVAVESRGGARIFARTSAGQVTTAELVGTTLSAWTSLGGTGIPADPVAVTVPGFLAMVFARTSTGQVVYKQQNGDLSFPPDWTALGDLQITGNAAVTLEAGPDRAVVTARDAAGRVYVTTEIAALSGKFGAWQLISDPSVPESLAVTDPAVFSYRNDTPDGFKGYGVSFQTASFDGPVVGFFSGDPITTPQTSRSVAKAAGKFHKLAHPAKKPGQALKKAGPGK